MNTPNRQRRIAAVEASLNQLADTAAEFGMTRAQWQAGADAGRAYLAGAATQDQLLDRGAMADAVSAALVAAGADQAAAHSYADQIREQDRRTAAGRDIHAAREAAAREAVDDQADVDGDDQPNP